MLRVAIAVFFISLFGAPVHAQSIAENSERVARLESAYEYLATKADVESVRTEVESVRTEVESVRTEIANLRGEVNGIKWTMGGGFLILVGITLWTHRKPQ